MIKTNSYSFILSLVLSLNGRIVVGCETLGKIPCAAGMGSNLVADLRANGWVMNQLYSVNRALGHFSLRCYRRPNLNQLIWNVLQQQKSSSGKICKKDYRWWSSSKTGFNQFLKSFRKDLSMVRANPQRNFLIKLWSGAGIHSHQISRWPSHFQKSEAWMDPSSLLFLLSLRKTIRL